MKRLTLALVALAICALPASAVAKTVTPRHAGVYEFVYHHAAAKFGARAPGRNLLRDGRSDGKAVTDAAVLVSTHTLERMLTPPPPPVVVHNPTISYGATTATSTTPTTSYSGGGLVQCILSHEGASPTTVNSSGHAGIGQWDHSTWIADGGGRYSSSPTGASYGQQLGIIQSQVAAGNTGQWTNYDGC